MKKTMKMMLALMAGAMAFTACSSDDILENNEVVENASQLKPMTFTAIQEGQGGTRTTIDGLDIKWTAGDKISIFDGSNAYGGDQMFTIENGAGTTSATFTGSAASSATYYALYPYAVGTTSETRIPTQAEAEAAAGDASDYFDFWRMMIGDGFEDMVIEDMQYNNISAENQAIILAFLKNQSTTIINRGVELDGSSIKNVVIPAEQTVAEGQTVDPQAMIMVAKGDDANTLAFKNVCAYVKVTPQFDCTAIALTSKGSENLAGTMTVNYNDGEPTTTVTAGGTNTVYLVGNITADNAYYIAVRPEALASGFTIEFLTADKNTYYARSTSNTLNLTRSNVKNLGEFTTSSSWTRSSATSGNDGAGHDWLLVTPTLKINTPASFEHVTFADITPWTGWELPSADELFEACSNGAITNNNYVSYTFRGIGILKYGKSVEVSGIIYNQIWTSTPVADNAERQHVIYVNDNTISWVTKSPTQKACVLRKYNN